MLGIFSFVVVKRIFNFQCFGDLLVVVFFYQNRYCFLLKP